MRSVSQLSMSSVFMSWFLVEVIYNPGDSLKNTFNSPSFARPHDGKPASRVSDDRERVTSAAGVNTVVSGPWQRDKRAARASLRNQAFPSDGPIKSFKTSEVALSRSRL